MTRVVVTETAKADISTIIDDLEQRAGAPTAEAYARAVADALRRLAAHPAIGPPRADLGAFARMIVLKPYLLMYRYEPGPGKRHRHADASRPARHFRRAV